MSINPSPLDPTALACPVCGEPIDILRPSVDLTEEQRVEATEMLVLVHVQVRHTTHDVLVALGAARNALMDIRDDHLADAPLERYAAFKEVIERGLAGK